METSDKDKPPWNSLSLIEQRPWLQHAAYILERGYPTEENLYKLAEILYNKST